MDVFVLSCLRYYYDSERIAMRKKKPKKKKKKKRVMKVEVIVEEEDAIEVCDVTSLKSFSLKYIHIYYY